VVSAFTYAVYAIPMLLLSVLILKKSGSSELSQFTVFLGFSAVWATIFNNWIFIKLSKNTFQNNQRIRVYTKFFNLSVFFGVVLLAILYLNNFLTVLFMIILSALYGISFSSRAFLIRRLIVDSNFLGATIQSIVNIAPFVFLLIFYWLEFLDWDVLIVILSIVNYLQFVVYVYRLDSNKSIERKQYDRDGGWFSLVSSARVNSPILITYFISEDDGKALAIIALASFLVRPMSHMFPLVSNAIYRLITHYNKDSVRAVFLISALVSFFYALLMLVSHNSIESFFNISIDPNVWFMVLILLIQTTTGNVRNVLEYSEVQLLNFNGLLSKSLVSLFLCLFMIFFIGEIYGYAYSFIALLISELTYVWLLKRRSI